MATQMLPTTAKKHPTGGQAKQHSNQPNRECNQPTNTTTIKRNETGTKSNPNNPTISKQPATVRTKTTKQRSRDGRALLSQRLYSVAVGYTSGWGTVRRICLNTYDLKNQLPQNVCSNVGRESICLFLSRPLTLWPFAPL